ncbi:hypothetical protein K458DRAFT_419674 [Lentithecium fluviatile CBS 122367]|uniref:Uncharacterized protein n=1 Tax=Lentithecium fluviatile CBS 122367 TaxID=1168545 RepID=A0A6G1IY19_9PLEO|nr:hypothetical protein K458DRAFT_419674 [Lentithecium fluviatile CBS 122367]
MVYITSHLFGSEAICDCPTAPATIHSQAWNIMVDTQLTAGLGKRKRRADSDEEGSKPTGCSSQQRSSPASKGLLRLHGHAPASDTNNNRMYPVTVAASTSSTPERRPVKQMRRMHPKVALVKSTSHLMDIELDPAPISTANNHSDLRPCHACNTAPKRRRDLENYMECRRCDERTCYICARECVGCHKAICKKCIVEVGEEGDPWCLNCYSKRLNS